MPLRAIFLDLGNTLVREVPSRFEIYAEAARGRGIAIEGPAMKALMARAHAALPREIEGHFRYSDAWFEAFVRRIFHAELGLPPSSLPSLTAELFARFEDPRTFALHPGARELLEALRARGLVVGIVSNWSARLPRVLRAVEIDRSIDFFLCSALERMEKPDPAIFHAALARAGARPDQALHAGDHPEKDVRGARAVGLEAVLVDHGGAAGAIPVEGVPLVRGLAELQAYILERSR